MSGELESAGAVFASQREMERLECEFEAAHLAHLDAQLVYSVSPSGFNAALMSRARFARSDAFDRLAAARRAVRETASLSGDRALAAARRAARATRAVV